MIIKSNIKEYKLTLKDLRTMLNVKNTERFDCQNYNNGKDNQNEEDVNIVKVSTYEEQKIFPKLE